MARETPLSRIAPAIPALLLVGIALNQIFLAHTLDLNPWKGGGFGMFSTGTERHVHLFAVESTGEREVDLPDELEDLEERLCVLPSPSRLDEFGLELVEALRAEHPDLEAVRVEVWSTSYDVDDLTPESVELRDVRYEVPSRGSR